MYNFLVSLQSMGNEGLTVFMKLVSDFIRPLPLSIFAVIIYWCINKKVGIKLALSIVSSVSFNTLIKFIFKIPRPFLVDDRIKRLDDTTGYSFPSGHTQLASSMATKFYLEYRKVWVLLLGLFLAILVGVSRMYLGMHSPLDTSVGLVLGILSALLVKVIYDLSEKKNNINYLHIVTLLATAFLFFTEFDEDLVKMAAISLGAIEGLRIDIKFIGYEAPKGAMKKVLVGIVGVILLLIAKFALSIIPDTRVFDYIEYLIFGAVITCGIPYLLKKWIIKE